MSSCQLFSHNDEKVSNIENFGGAGEMAQRLRALAALPEAPSSIPSNHIVVYNHL